MSERYTYTSSLDLSSKHDYQRGALLPRHLPEIRARIGQRPLAGDIAVYETGGRNFHLRIWQNIIIRGY